MLKNKFLCGFLSVLMSLAAADLSVCRVYAVQESTSETEAVTSEVPEDTKTDDDSDESEKADGTDNDKPVVTVNSEYAAGDGMNDAEEYKTSENDITKQCDIVIPDYITDKSTLINDKNRATKISFKAGDEITVSNDKSRIYSIYIIWDTPPEEWKLSYNVQSARCGQNGFIHEYIRLDTPAEEFKMTLPSDATICDIFTFTKGEKPAWVQQWKPPCENADILLLPARGNNEIVDFGGFLPYYAGEVGAKVQVAYMVNQWMEYYRPHEILNALWECGVTYYPVFGDFADCEVQSYDDAAIIYNQSDVTGYVVSLLRRFKPQIAVGQDLRGEGGNGISMIYSKALAEACEISADSSKYPESATEYGTWDVPKTYLHLYGYTDKKNPSAAVTDTTDETETTGKTTKKAKETDETLETDEFGEPVISEETGVHTVPEYDGDIEYLVKPIEFDWSMELERFDNKSAYEVAATAFLNHKSQVNWISMADADDKKTGIFGLYRTTVGYDKGKTADVLENANVVIQEIISDDMKSESYASFISEKYRGKARSSPVVLAIGIITAIGTAAFAVYKKVRKK